MKRWSLLAIGLGAYALALIATAPATLMDAGLQRASDGRLRLAEAQGTLWSGTGQIEIRDTGGRTGVAKNFAWRVAPRIVAARTPGLRSRAGAGGQAFSRDDIAIPD